MTFREYKQEEERSEEILTHHLNGKHKQDDHHARVCLLILIQMKEILFTRKWTTIHGHKHKVNNNNNTERIEKINIRSADGATLLHMNSR